MWINIKNRMPRELESVIILIKCDRLEDCFYKTAWVCNGKFITEQELDDDMEILAWMPMPSFDKILEDTKDVLT